MHRHQLEWNSNYLMPEPQLRHPIHRQRNERRRPKQQENYQSLRRKWSCQNHWQKIHHQH